MKQTRLGDMLVRLQRITPDQLEAVKREMTLQGDSLTTELVKMNIFSEEELAGVIAKAFGRPLINLDAIQVPKDLAKISIEVLRKNVVLPVQRKGNVLTLAVADPYDINSLDEIAFISGCQVDVVIARESQLQKKLDSLSDAEEHLEEVMQDLGANDMQVVETAEDEVDEHMLTAGRPISIWSLMKR